MVVSGAEEAERITEPATLSLAGWLAALADAGLPAMPETARADAGLPWAANGAALADAVLPCWRMA